MSDLQKYIQKRKKKSSEFAREYDALCEENHLKELLNGQILDALLIGLGCRRGDSFSHSMGDLVQY